MRLTALCVFATLLGFLSLSWTTADSAEGDLLGDNGFGPCAAILRPEGPCREGEDESTCPYLFSLPPLTVHLPKQLKELERIVMDLEKLKDNVDQLRKMCADCTVSQTERECGGQRVRERERLNVGMDRGKDEGNPGRLKDTGQECGRVEKTMEEDGDTASGKREILEEEGRKKWEAEKESNKGVIKINEKEGVLKEMSENDGKTQTEGANRKDSLGQAKVTTAGENERIVDVVRKKVAEKNSINNRETEAGRHKEKDGKGYSKGDREDKLENGKEKKITSNVKNTEKTKESDHHVWRDETEKKTQIEDDRGSDGIKMSQEHGEHTDEEREQERKKEMEKGIKVERNNEKPKQTGSTGHAEKEKTIKAGEVEEENRETGKEIKTGGEKTVQSIQRDSDGELASSKATEKTDFVSISLTPHSTISLAPRHDSIDSGEAVTLASSLPSPPLSGSTSHLITDGKRGMTITSDGLSTQRPDLAVAGISKQPSPDAETGSRTTSRPTTATTVSSLGGQGQQMTSDSTSFTSTSSARPGASFQGRISSTDVTTTTTTPHPNLYTTTFPGIADRSRWTTKKNISLNTKAGVKPVPGRGTKPSEKHKPPIMPKAEDQNHKNPKNASKPGRPNLPEKITYNDQKQRPSHLKPQTEQKSKPGKDPKRVQFPKSNHRPPPDNLPTDQNLKNNQIPKLDEEHSADQNQMPTQKPNSHQKSMLPVQRPTSHQRPQTVNTTGFNKATLTDSVPESTEIPLINQSSKPEKKPVHTLKTDKPEQKQKPQRRPKSEEKTSPVQRSTSNQYLITVQENDPEGSETASATPKPNQKPVTEFMENSYNNSPSEPKSVKDSTPGLKLTPDCALSKPPDEKPKPSQEIPKINQKPKPAQTPHLNQKPPELQKTKPNVKPKPDQTPQTNQGLRTLLPDQMPNLNPKSVPDEIPEAESNKPSKLRPPPRHRPSTKPTVKPGATPVQRPKPAVQLEPSSKTKTDLDPPQISGTSSDGIQNSQTDMPPASGPAKHTAEVTHSPGIPAEFSPSTMKTMTLGPKTSNSPKTGPFPRTHAVFEGFKMSPNSRITSDPRPQTASQPPSIPMTTRPNKVMSGILPSVMPSTSPGSTKPDQASTAPETSLQAKILHKVEDTSPRKTPESDQMVIPARSPSVHTISTTSPNFRSTTSGPEPLVADSSTPSARELRVKINQVAAFLNNSLTPNGRPPERRPKEHPEDSRPERTGSKPPARTPLKGKRYYTEHYHPVTTERRDCSDLLLRGETRSGVYLVTPDLRSRSFPVSCDMDLDGGGWTLLQRRQDGSVSFNRTWAEYREGFGELDGGEFWLGNNMIHLLTRDRDVVLRVELEDFDGVKEYAEYEHFRVGSERTRYRLTVGGYSGTAGDALRFSKTYDHNNRAFTTPDRDHDRYPSGNCGAYYSSGWWFDACMAANLNGRYHVGRYKGVRDGIFWGTWHNISKEYYPTNDRQSFKTARMMIRPKGFAP
ncbi:hypothetical protein L3Q82_024021 [Scortum barcoo]|uniref:Uncharacterized protein n=1 Tax=Scortum barcoo TaxID=214431 RepID=A0ACB8WVU1_9TELE|nr:hypothetical protein L3Q82_024021 [Scortum barcoo]